MNAKECAPELRRQHVIAESTETDIERARDTKTASGILYDHLYRNCTVEQIVLFSKILTEVDGGFGRTRQVGQQMSARMQGTGSGSASTQQNMGPYESQLHSIPPQVPTFAERVVKTHITKQGFHRFELKFSAEAEDVATGIKAEGKNYKSEGGAKEHARINLKAILLERGIIRKD